VSEWVVMHPSLDKKCPVMINRRPYGRPIVRTGILGNLDLYECPKGHRTTLAAKKEEAEFENIDYGEA
jgi:hypothetical protein